MYQAIGEEIQVVGVFAQGKFRPKKFQWRRQVYPIEEITLTAKARDGEVRYQYFSVLSRGNLYRLQYNWETQHWIIAEVWCEG